MQRRGTIAPASVAAAVMQSDEDDYIPMEKDLTIDARAFDDDESEDSVRAMDTVLGRISKYARLVLPHVGLVALLTCYTLMGAVVFHILELPDEERKRNLLIGDVLYKREKMKGVLWKLVNETQSGHDDFNNEADKYINELIVASYAACMTGYISHDDVVAANTKPSHFHWDFPNSIFFSTTVITTIGYGNLAPATEWGRIFCISFGLLGIPLLLVTIADIGKFLSDFLNFIYRTYRALVRKIRRHSRRLSVRARRSLSKSPTPDLLAAERLLYEDTGSEGSAGDELHIPMVMVLLVLLGYTALGGLLFRYLEGWHYFDAFYFCFITMSTVGFGDLVPTEQTFMLITMGYIILGLALTTMCIDLAGTEYIRKIHYLGQKMETAKSAMVSGLHAGENILRTTGYGFIRTAGGRLVAVGAEGYDEEDLIFADEIQRNILYEPLSPVVQRAVNKARIHVLPDHLTEQDVGVTIHNRTFNRQKRPRKYVNPNKIYTTRIYRRMGRRASRQQQPVILVAPFLWKESHV